jgi:hypothetical protein
MQCDFLHPYRSEIPTSSNHILMNIYITIVDALMYEEVSEMEKFQKM